jgi:hypothetical protein
MILRIRAHRAIAIIAILAAGMAWTPGSAAAASSGLGTGRDLAGTAGSLSMNRQGVLTGTVVGGDGRPLGGVCVAASPATRGAPGAAVRTAVTSAAGMFLLTGLPAGPYRLTYRHCLVGTGGVTATLVPAQGPGALTATGDASSGYVTGGQVTTLGRITVRRAGGPATDRPLPAALKRLPLTTLGAGGQKHSDDQDFGGIAGTVLGPHGRRLKGLCFNIYFRGGYESGPIGANGRYDTGKNIPAGTYTVAYSPLCGLVGTPASGNWATEWFRGKFRPSAANAVVIKAGKITRGIGGTMRPGGVISGTVTGQGGRGLARVCVVAATPSGTNAQQVLTSRSGRYRFQGLDPGRYGIGFFPGCVRGSGYFSSWWPGTNSESRRGLIRTGFGTTRSRVDQRLVLGGTISGVVKFRNRHGKAIRGICVDATPAGQPDGQDYPAATNASGRYSIIGLPAGRYALNFGPGCNNNGNYLSQNYPHPVTARLARVTRGIDSYLQPGGIIEGTVTSRSTGAPLRGICVETGDGYSFAVTGVDGSYAINQLSPGQVQLDYFNCSPHGNYAPESYPHSIRVGLGQVVRGIDVALPPGATISGTIALTTGGKPTNVCVLAMSAGVDADLDNGGGASSSRGSYAIENLPPGWYQVQYSACGGPNIADTWFAGPGRTSADQTVADQIYLPAGGGVAGIDAVLERGGSISSWIYGPAKQQGSFVCPTITDLASGLVSSEDFAGSIGSGITIWGFAPGKYSVEFQPCGGQNLALQWYDRASRPGLATPVLVRPGRATWNIDAWLSPGGTLTGRVVSKTSGRPLAHVCVWALGVNVPFFGYGGTSRSGDYVVTGLNTGTYRLYLTSCGQTHLVPEATGPVRAIAGKTVAGPRVTMITDQVGAISGRITAAGSPPKPAAGTCPEAVPLTRGFTGTLEEGSGFTGKTGYYRITGLVPGKYKVFVTACDTDVPLVSQWYSGTSQEVKATVVSVAPGSTTRSVNVTLQRYGAISGAVTGSGPAKAPLPGICVQATPAGQSGTPYLTESGSKNGDYEIGPLPPGRYLVEFEADCAVTGYATQWWRDATSRKRATLVTVRAGRTHVGVDASMNPAN